jgi:hypothetical protein
MMRRLHAYLVLLVPIVVLFVIYGRTEHFFLNQYDDSYITYRYAINLALGEGLVFNVGERTDAASSFLYTLLLAGAWLLELRNLELVGGLAGVASLWVVCLFVFKLANHLSNDKTTALVVALICGLNGFLSGWTLSGMETLPWTATVLVAVYLLVTNTSPLLSISAIALASLIRFEGVFLMGAYALSALNDTGQAKKKKALLAVSLLVILGAFYVIKHEYYNVWISHAYKMKGMADYYRADPASLFRNWFLYCSLPVLLGLHGMLSKMSIPVIAYIVVSFASLSFGPASDWSRYSVHLLPLFYAYAAVPISKVKSEYSSPSRYAFALVMIPLMLIQAAYGHAFNYKNMTSLAKHQICRKQLGEYLVSNTPISETIASADIGAISYTAINHRFVDLVALTSVDVLEAYGKGENADGVLALKNVRYMADTFGISEAGNDRIKFLLGQFPKARQDTKYAVDANPVFSCSADRLFNVELRRLSSSGD